MKNNSKIKKLAFMAVLLCAALIIFIIEAQIPLPVPIPGVKPGLSNAVILFALFYNHAGKKRESNSRYNRLSLPYNIKLSNFDVFLILVGRIILSAFFTGRVITFAFSLCGGLTAFFAMLIMKKFVNNRQIWVCGAVGAVFHNIGQIIIAIFITGTPAIIAYLPVLIIAGIITGVFTGLIAQFTLLRMSKIK